MSAFQRISKLFKKRNYKSQSLANGSNEDILSRTEIKTRAFKLVLLWKNRFLRLNHIQYITKDIINLIIKYYYTSHSSTNVFICGAHGDGKTVVKKQIVHHFANASYHEENNEMFDMKITIPYIREACVGYIKILCIYSKQLHEMYNKPTQCQPEHVSLRDQILQLQPPYKLQQNLAKQISMLWSDAGIQKTLELRHYFQIHDNVKYFLDNIERIARKDYFPNFEDYIRIETRSTGFDTCEIDTYPMISTIVSNQTINIAVGAGCRSERKKWMNSTMDNIDAFIYIMGIGDYDLNCFEDNTTLKLKESLDLFECMASGNNYFKKRCFDGCGLYILLNKYEIFLDKLKTIPITFAFEDEYPNEMNPSDEDDVVKFIVNKMINILECHKVNIKGPLVIHKTTAVDTMQMKQAIHHVFDDIMNDGAVE